MLQWMHDTDINILDASSLFDAMYSGVLGIPMDPRPDFMLFAGNAERVFVHTALEHMQTAPAFDAAKVLVWEQTPVTAAKAVEAIESFRGNHQQGAHMLASMLVHHLGAEAFEPVVMLMGAGDRFYEADKRAGELVVTLAHLHPELKGRALDAVAAVGETMGKACCGTSGRAPRLVGLSERCRRQWVPDFTASATRRTA